MIAYLLFLGGLFVLYLLSRLITRTLSLALYHQTRSQSVTIYTVALLFFPGVVLHELSHYIAAVFMGVRAGNIEFLPKIAHGHLKLGSVQIERTDPLRKTIIAIAPVIGGCLAILGSIYLVRNVYADSYVIIALAILFIYQVANTMFSSTKDLEGTGIFVLFLILLIGVLWVFDVPVLSFFLESTYGLFVQSLLLRGSWYLGIAIAIDIVVLICLFLLRYLQKR